MENENNFSNQPYENIPQTQPVYNGGAGGPEIKPKENYFLGILGAFLFSLGGVAVYFGFYQLNFISGISGWIMFILARFGYGVFTKTAKKITVASMITAIVITVVMIFVAQYISVAFIIFSEFKDLGITFMDAFVATPDFLAEPDIMRPFLSDLGFAYLFSLLGIAGNVFNFFKQKKAEKADINNPQTIENDIEK